VAAIVAWVLVPLGRCVYYLSSSAELARVRSRAISSTVATVAVAGGALGLIPAPDRCYVEGVVEPVQVAIVHAASDGFLKDHLPSGAEVCPDGPPLARSENPVLEAEARLWEARRRGLLASRSLATTQEVAAVQIVDEQIKAVDDRLRQIRELLADLQVHAPFAGVWLSPTIDLKGGAYLKRGDPIGVAATLDQTIIRAVATQNVVGLLVTEGSAEVDMRVDGRPDARLAGTVTQILPAGLEHAPSAALTYAGGGSIPISLDDRRGTKAAERIFEIRVAPDPESGVRLLSGQRVILRFENRAKPLLAQWYRWFLQLIQRRFKV
jgi:hypothetical protein